MPQTNYTLTLEEVSKRLNRSKKTISRYIKKGLLSPSQDISDKGTLTYKFSEEDLEKFKTGQARQDRTQREDKTGHKQNKDRVNDLHNAKTRQDNDRTNDNNNDTGKFIDTLIAQLQEKDKQFAELQNTVKALTETVKQNTLTLQGYSIKLLQLTEGKTRQDITGHKVKAEDRTKRPDIKNTKTKKAKPAKKKEDQTDQTKKTGQIGQIKKKSLLMRILTKKIF